MLEAPALENAALLSVAGLCAWYGESQVLHGIDFHVGKGSSSRSSGATALERPRP